MKLMVICAKHYAKAPERPSMVDWPTSLEFRLGRINLRGPVCGIAPERPNMLVRHTVTFLNILSMFYLFLKKKKINVLSVYIEHFLVYNELFKLYAEHIFNTY